MEGGMPEAPCPPLQGRALCSQEGGHIKRSVGWWLGGYPAMFAGHGVVCRSFGWNLLGSLWLPSRTLSRSSRARSAISVAYNVGLDENSKLQWNQLSASIVILRRKTRSGCSVRSSAAAKMSILGGSRAEGPGRLATPRLAQMNGSRMSAKSPRSNAQIAASSIFYRLPMTSFAFISPAMMIMVGISPWASTPCFLTRPAFSSQPISIKQPGSMMRRLFSKHAAVWRYQPCLRGPALAMAAISGSSSSEAVPAVLARKLGSYILTETMERRPDLGLDSYDRLFPNQDTLPKGGFGSLIALPLQNKPRKLGNSVFLDDTATPFCDQWSFLSGIRRIRRDEIDGIVRKAEAKGQVVGVRCYPVDEEEEDTLWEVPASPRVKAIAGPLPRNLELILSNEIYIAKEDLPPALRNRLVRLAAFQNPEFYRAQAMRLPTYDTPRVVGCARDYPRHLGLPRGCQADLLQTLSDLTIPCSTRDERCQGNPLSVSFRGELRPEQRVAAEAMLAHETGVLSATTAFGKTVVAAWIIAQRAVNTLVLVHRRQLQEQWIEALSRF